MGKNVSLARKTKGTLTTSVATPYFKIFSVAARRRSLSGAVMGWYPGRGRARFSRVRSSPNPCS